MFLFLNILLTQRRMKRFEVYSQYMGFVLEGRPLKACFGTTKYCHAWLRSMPCTNPDCLYLHEFESQEDSFTKDEIIYDYTRYSAYRT
ncbi:putative CCR4-NOT transcription complex subunit 4 [Helianthus anomalus]